MDSGNEKRRGIHCNSKCYENTDGQPGGHRSRRGRGPRMAWPPCAPQPSEMAGDPDGRVRGRGPQAKRSGKDSPEGAYQPRPPACRRLPDGRERALPPRRPPATPRRDLRENEKGRYRSSAGTAGHGEICRRTKRGDIVRREGQEGQKGALCDVGGVRPRGAHRSIIRMVLPTILRKSG